jgi:chromosome segregation ATPase
VWVIQCREDPVGECVVDHENAKLTCGFTHSPTPAKQDALDRKLTRLEKMLHRVEGEFSTQWSRWRDELTQTLQSKASHSDLTASLDTHSKQFETLRHEIQSSSKDYLSHLATQADKQTKADEKLSHLKAHMHELLGIVETLQGEQTALKTLTIDHVQQQTDGQTHDTKQAVLKLHDAVKSVRHSVESVAKRAELEALNEQVAWIRKQLRSEIYQARYVRSV